MGPNLDQLARAIDAMRSHTNRALLGLTAVRRKVYRLEALERLAAAGRAPRLPLAFQSQFGEDMVLCDLFEGKLDGFYVECGAVDGVNCSVSYAFEAMGWTGLLVEAAPEPAALCAQRRPHSRTVHAAVSRKGSSGTATFNVVREESTWSFLNPTPEQLRMIQQAGRTAQPVTVPLTTLDSLLADHRGTIDFAMIDVEGNELDVLDGFDLDRFRPRVLITEENNPTANSPLVASLQSRGYHHIGYLWVNHFFVRRDDAEMMDRARRTFLF